MGGKSHRAFSPRFHRLRSGPATSGPGPFLHRLVFVVCPVSILTHHQENAGNEVDDFSKKEYADLASELLASGHVPLTHDELLALEAKLPEMPITKAREIMSDLYPIHLNDPRYSPDELERMRMFTQDPDVIANPERHALLVYEMQISTLLSTTSSPYAEVRAVASDTDDPEMPSLTIRVFVLGTVLAGIGCVINAVFGLRYPGIGISAGMVQLLSCTSKWTESIADNCRPLRCGVGQDYAPLAHFRSPP